MCSERLLMILLIRVPWTYEHEGKILKCPETASLMCMEAASLLSFEFENVMKFYNLSLFGRIGLRYPVNSVGLHVEPFLSGQGSYREV